MPAAELPSHIKGLIAYLSAPEEKANEDMAIAYFRKISGDSFTRQKEAHRADGYVPGSFVLELKGKTADWLSGLFQALAYKNQGLDFSQIVVAAKEFLVLWQVDDLDEKLREEVLLAGGSPNAIGARFARKYRDRRNQILKAATWNAMLELSGSLFISHPELIAERIKSFENALREGRKVRQKVTPKNFAAVLKEMKGFFDPAHPVKTVRAFYSMVYAWDESSTVQLSEKNTDKATLGGETITNLVPSKRLQFKDFVENRCIYLGPGENIDDFFARYDEALDAVDKDFRKTHGIFFTDRDLSKFVMWIVRQHIPSLGKNYLVIDPACGSGNLVTNWRSPLELRHKVVSEIEPELLFAVDRRMKGDQWHNGKFTVVPKVSENVGLNFLDRSAEEYLEILRAYLAEKGHKPDKPLAFLCNPPYRSDDDQSVGGITYTVHKSIVDVTGLDASSERYCCFLAQMKLICDAARSSGFPENSKLLLFTKTAWLTNRAIFAKLREQMLQTFEHETGILVNGSEFFDVKGKWPLAFTVWKYDPKRANAGAQRNIQLFDLTWLKKSQLTQLPWDSDKEMDNACLQILNDHRVKEIPMGEARTSIRKWSGQTRVDFMRNRRMNEINQRIVGGLPLGDHRQNNKKAYGEFDGKFIGFMDDLTPCRGNKSIPDRPWFMLDGRFMAIRGNRCLSGPPTHLGYCAADLEAAKKLFFWYSLSRTYLQHPYPMWADSDDMWQPEIPQELEQRLFITALAIGYAENECVETTFPANNPVRGVPELAISNPLTPLNPRSFWCSTLRTYCKTGHIDVADRLIKSVDSVFTEWRSRFKARTELPVSRKAYSLEHDPHLRIGSGIIQIVHYANETSDKTLVDLYVEMQRVLRAAKTEFFDLVVNGAGYFGLPKKPSASATAGSYLVSRIQK